MSARSKNQVFIIAEAGVNHNGSIKRARQLIDVAADAGADAVKFQSFHAESLVTKTAPMARYQRARSEERDTQYDMLKRLELDARAHFELLNHCSQRKIMFLSTPFDEENLDFLVCELNMSRIKIPSGEITNAAQLLQVARYTRPLLLSTGLSTLKEVRDALGVLAFGLLRSTERPCLSAFRAAFKSQRGQSSLRRHVTLLHCTTEYPAPPADMNLRAIDSMRDAFGLPVGLSDHSAGIAIAIAAAARGAALIEKHFTLDRNLPGPDHHASIEPAELKLLVSSIREVELALGDGKKRPAPSELKNITVVRRSVVAARAIAKGEAFTEENLAVKRPQAGRPAIHYWDLMGKRATKNYRPDEGIG